MALARASLAREFRIDPSNTLPENEFSFGFSLKPCFISDIEKIFLKNPFGHISGIAPVQIPSASVRRRGSRENPKFLALYTI